MEVVFAGIVVAVRAATAHFSSPARRALRRIRRLRRVDIGRAREGTPVLIVGRIQEVSRSLAVPVTGRPCAAYDVMVREGNDPFGPSVRAADKAHRQAQARLAVRRRRLDALVTAGKTSGRGFASAAVEHPRRHWVVAEARAVAATKATAARQDADARRIALDDRIAKARARATSRKI